MTPATGRPRQQQERSRATQNRILDAAVVALINHGYAGASTLRIQEIAKVSRGRLLHQFPSRDHLLVAAVQHLAAARIQAVRERIDWPSQSEARIDAAVEALWSTYHQGEFWAATELWLAARHNSELCKALLPAERQLGERVRNAVDLMFGVPLNRHPAYPALRELINTSMRGVAMVYAFDRRPPESDSHLDDWKKIAREALRAPDSDL